MNALDAQLKAAGHIVPTGGLNLTDTTLLRNDAAGALSELPAGGQTIVNAYTPPPLITEVSGRFDIGVQKRTTDATVTEIYRATLAPLTLYRARLELLGIDAGNGVARYLEATVIVKRLGAGALLVGTPAVTVDKQDTGGAAVTSGVASWAIAASVTGNDLTITVAGAAGRSVDWFLAGPVVSFTPAGI
jgi:hypothetical protein